MQAEPRRLAYAFLRVTTGSVFLFYGIGKLQAGPAHFAAGLAEGFAKTWIPPIAVRVFGFALPFCEVTAGALLVLGFFTRFGIALASLLIVMLTVGQTIAGQSDGVAHNLVYALVLFLLMRHVAENGYALDRRR